MSKLEGIEGGDRGGDSYNAEINRSIIGGRGNVNFMFNLPEAQGENTEALAMLQRKIAPGAFHNSDERYDPPKCHPNTRSAVLRKIMAWVKDVQKSSKFMWLYGPAGSGKSAIAQTIAEMCYEAGLLAGSFFFSRTVTGRNEKTYLITTLVYQMILVVPEVRGRVIKALEHDPMVFSTSLKAQAQALMLKPLKEAVPDLRDRQALMSRPLFMIVDGLDECNDKEAQAYIIETLLYVAQQSPLPTFFLIASRPEQEVRDAFNEEEIASLTTTLVLDDTYHPLADIKVLLESKFAEIKRKHPARLRFPKPWPAEDDVSQLVKKSSGQFIYAATVIKYIESRRHLPPDRLQIVLGLSDPGNDAPFAELDALYNHILSTVFNVDKVIKLFMVFLFTGSKVKKKLLTIEDFLLLRPGEIDIVLSDLNSLIMVPPPEDENADLRITHASLTDFLQDRSRSRRFFIDSGLAHADILRLLLQHLTKSKGDGNNYYHWSSMFTDHYQKANQTPELLSDLYAFDLVFFFDFASSFYTPAPDEKRPMRWGNKVPLDDRWPNLAQLFSWLQRLRHPDPSGSFHNIYIDTFSTWLYMQLTRFYPLSSSDFPGTPLLLAAVTLSSFFPISRKSNVHDLIHSVKPWPDISTRRWRDPIHIYDVYGDRSGESGSWYYTAIGEFLRDKDRAKEYFVDETLYAQLAEVILQYYAEHSQWSKQAEMALILLSETLDRSTRTPELSKILKNNLFRCADPEDQLYSRKNDVADKVDTFLSA